MKLNQITDDLLKDLAPMKFGSPVHLVYNPLEYARASWDLYLERYARSSAEFVLLGMNPGPFGMAQTGIPFGEIDHVRRWMGITAPVGKPPVEHPKRPILGFDCTRSEVSGRRLWSWAAARSSSADAFFDRCFVFNYCPLIFLEEGGRNRTPDKLPKAERTELFEACDRSLRALITELDPTWVIGVGKFAEDRARRAFGTDGPRIGRICHPSPASPKANRGWAPIVDAELEALGVNL